MASLLEIIARAEQLAAGVAQDASRSTLLDSEMTAEAIFPHAVRYTLERLARTGGDVQDLLAEQTINVKGGEGELPEAVLKNALKFAIFPGRPLVSWVSYPDFLRYRFSKQLDYFSYFGRRFFFSAAGAANSSDDGIDVVLWTATIPAMPTTADEDVALSAAIIEEIILIMATVLRGEMPLSALMDK